MQRRQWLKTMGGAALGLALPAIASRVYALPAQADARFLLVFLRGGYDAASVLVPAGSDFYYAARPNLAIRRPPAPGADADPNAAVALAAAFGADSAARGIGDWALHPALAPTLLPLWQQGQLAFVPFAGTHDLSRSHFETQDGIEAGLPGHDESRQAVAALRGSGFLNRLAQAMGGQAAPVAFTDGLPLVLSGPRDVPNVSLKGSGRAPFDARQVRLLAQMYRGTRFESLIDEGFELRETVARQAQAEAPSGSMGGMAGAGPATMASRQQEMQAASRRALSARGFEVEARRMAGLMRERFNLGFIDVGGWDTHVNQGAAQGQLAGLLDNLGRGLSAFAAEMGPAWSKTTVVVLSEFGRTFRENGTRGTDHGHGTVYWVLGGSVRGGRIAGEQVAVEAATLNQDRDWPVRNEYRALLGGLFRRLYGLDAERLAQVFPGVAGRDIGLV
ncbi:DUF1501 domain-containing protein [Cupriavidus neocaledonicus]|uniref:DUF1501 domain-containing protein n=1 Tax=Cupriavidus neocaledonicus TaxID=1040979 RepID=A0A375HR55_9BURK|nr:DUF1501 domain-containing protein [Cupriavidus neocaledonicus]SOZ39089.1 conserved hypothetical protein, DUF1501; putative exported protein [Cupriavidus neocaledonicus]SPD59240.1 conserved exported protein of unknown function [Cupriavidus neocaledonicus]